MNIGGGDDDDWETDPDFVVSVIIQVLCVHFLCRFRISILTYMLEVRQVFYTAYRQ